MKRLTPEERQRRNDAADLYRAASIYGRYGFPSHAEAAELWASCIANGTIQELRAHRSCAKCHHEPHVGRRCWTAVNDSQNLCACGFLDQLASAQGGLAREMETR